jgi:malic enzyme
MEFVKEAFQEAKQKYNNYLAELKKKDLETYNELMLIRQKREARKDQLPLAIRYSPGALELYNKYKELPTEKLLAQYYSGEENIRRIPKKYRPIVLSVKEGKEPPKLEEVLQALSEKKRTKKTKAKK